VTGARVGTWLWLAQRASAAVLALAVVVHLVTIVYATRGGLSAAEILDRVQGNAAWLAFYAVFVLAAAIHAPIGLRAVLRESTPLPRPWIEGLCMLVAALLLAMGLRAAIGLYAFAP
jgi:fumarate reductase subunit C